MPETADWEHYYDALRGRPPRPHLLAALAHLPRAGTAIDLGAGDGADARHLLRLGWRVVAIDATPGLRERVLTGAPAGAADRLDARDAMFGEVSELPAADLVFASYALPFAGEHEFAQIWSLLAAAVRPGGLFAGQLFGDRDDWATRDDVRTHTAPQVRDLLAGWETIELAEHEYDGGSGAGPKHWHVFEILARRPPATPGVPS